MEIGFTGNRYGMTKEQKITFGKYIDADNSIRFHHGMCVGSDEEASDIAFSRGAFIIGHPGVSAKGGENELRSFCKIDTEREEKTHFARNRDIVDESDILFATPREFGEKDKGGTWYTIHYSWKINKPTIVIWPDGTTDVRK